MGLTHLLHVYFCYTFDLQKWKASREKGILPLIGLQNSDFVLTNFQVLKHNKIVRVFYLVFLYFLSQP